MRSFSLPARLAIILFALSAARSARADDAAKFPAFELPDLAGNVFKYSGADDAKPLVVNFFASWCTSCVEEIPLLEKMRVEKPSATLVGIDVGEDRARAKRFVDKYRYPWLALVDSEKALTDKLGITAIPITFVVGPEGRILYRGSRPPKDLAKEIARSHSNE